MAKFSATPLSPFHLGILHPSSQCNHIRAFFRSPNIVCCGSNFPTPSSSSSSAAAAEGSSATRMTSASVTKKRTRYRKLCPGEAKGITEEMRFVAMKLRNNKGKKTEASSAAVSDSNDKALSDGDDGSDSWQPTMEGFLKYLVDSKLVFSTVERIVDESDNVAYTYFRNNGLERSQSLGKDLEWFERQDIALPQPSSPGTSYAKYLELLAEQSAPLFLCHLYNIYFSHLSGGQVIAKQVCDKLLNGRELEFNRWDGDAQELLRGVREKLNMLGEHWPRKEKNKCLSEASRSFQYMGQIVRLIIII